MPFILLRRNESYLLSSRGLITLEISPNRSGSGNASDSSQRGPRQISDFFRRPYQRSSQRVPSSNQSSYPPPVIHREDAFREMPYPQRELNQSHQGVPLPPPSYPPRDYSQSPQDFSRPPPSYPPREYNQNPQGVSRPPPSYPPREYNQPYQPPPRSYDEPSRDYYPSFVPRSEFSHQEYPQQSERDYGYAYKAQSEWVPQPVPTHREVTISRQNVPGSSFSFRQSYVIRSSVHSLPALTLLQNPLLRFKHKQDQILEEKEIASLYEGVEEEERTQMSPILKPIKPSIVDETPKQTALARPTEDTPSTTSQETVVMIAETPKVIPQEEKKTMVIETPEETSQEEKEAVIVDTPKVVPQEEKEAVIVDTTDSTVTEESSSENDETPMPSQITNTPAEDTSIQIIDTSSSDELFGDEPGSPHAEKILPSIPIDEGVLSTIQEIGNQVGPSGLPLFNLNRLNNNEEDLKENSPPPVTHSIKSSSLTDSSVLISQLSQMDEPSSTSDEEGTASQVLREGEKEVKQVTSFSLLSLMKMNKQVASGVNASKQQAAIQPTVPVLKQRKKPLQPSLQNPREFLIDYITKLSVQNRYVFQNSRNLSLHSVYREYHNVCSFIE